MAAPSSSSSEVVDLGLAATLDDATSELFFSKGAGAGAGDQSLPAAAAAGFPFPSALTNQETLAALCRKHGVPAELKPVCADTLGCGVWETPPAGSNALCIFSDALEAGLRFPLHDFYLKLLRHYRLAPSQLVPNAWKYMAAFVLRCGDAGVEPRVDAFRYFFSLYAHKDRDKPSGWHHFQPFPGRRLFSGTLHTKQGWRTRFFFLQSPEGMPWKCPVAWGKPRREDARRMELTDAAVHKLKQMPCVDFKNFLGRHDPPVGVLTLLQQQHHPTPAPMVKPERAAGCGPALTVPSQHQQLHAILEAGARAASTAGEGYNSTPPLKRRCPGTGPAAVTPQSFTMSAAPPSLQAMETTPGTSFDGASGSNGISLPPGIWTGNSDYEFDMERVQGEQRDSQIAQLQARLQESEALHDKLVGYLYKKTAENDLLKEKHAQLIKEQAAVLARVKAERAAEVAKLQNEQVAAVAQLTKHLNDKHAAEVAKLQKEHVAAVAQLTKHLNDKHAADLAHVLDAAEKKVQDVKNDIVLILYPEADLSHLEGPKAQGRSRCSWNARS